MKIFFISFIIAIQLYASIGRVSALRGDVFVKRDGVSSKVFKGFLIENEDIFQTFDNSKAQLIFNDRTVITIGKNTVFHIEDYFYNRTKLSKAKFFVKKGFFSAITGKIGKVARNRFQLETENFTIGIRGTHFQGEIGEFTKIACLSGEIFVDVAGESFSLQQNEFLEIKEGIPDIPKKMPMIRIPNSETKYIKELRFPKLLHIKYQQFLKFGKNQFDKFMILEKQAEEQAEQMMNEGAQIMETGIEQSDTLVKESMVQSSEIANMITK